MGLGFSLEVQFTPADYEKRFAKNSEAFMTAASIVFRGSVFKFLEFLIRVSRVKYGRLKGGWTPIMDQYQHNWQRSSRFGPEESPTAVAIGKSEGSYVYDPQNNPWFITVSNAVKYAEILEGKPGVGVTELGSFQVLVPYFEKYFGENFEKFLENADKVFGDADYREFEDFGAPSEV